MMTPVQFNMYCAGLHKRMDEQQRISYENARTISFFAVAPHTKKIKDPTDLYKLRWDQALEKAKSAIMNQEDLKEMHKSFQFKVGKKVELKA